MAIDVTSSRSIAVTINGTVYEREVEARKLLIHFLRDDLDLTVSHIGCDTGNCGACSVIVDGTLLKSCMMLAVQADGATIESVEGLADGDELHPLQKAFAECGAIQCGYCSPGFIMAAKAFLAENPRPSRAEIADELEGNLCRCTGYIKIFEAIEAAAKALA